MASTLINGTWGFVLGDFLHNVLLRDLIFGFLTLVPLSLVDSVHTPLDRTPDNIQVKHKQYLSQNEHIECNRTQSTFMVC